MKIKLRASDSCERGHRHGEWALGSNVKLMAGIGVPVPSVNDGAIADRVGPPSESGRELQPRGGFSRGSPPARLSELSGGRECGEREVSALSGFCLHHSWNNPA